MVLCGQASLLRQMLKTPLGESEQRLVEGRLAAVRGEIGQDAAATAWAEGHATSPDRFELGPSLPRSVELAPRPDGSDVAELLKAAGLTRREAEVAQLVARGFPNRQIADQLGFTEKTAEAHVSNILQKLELSSRTQLAASIIGRNLLAPGGLRSA
jgi:DNA-binding NarL/FixJ family response regulator